MPDGVYLLQAAGLLPGEYRQLFNLRRVALDWVASEGSLYGPLPASERMGYRARITLLGRDRDGHLSAAVRVTAPHLTKAYVRRVRLVKQVRLPEGLR
jgi:hypothetical protein